MSKISFLEAVTAAATLIGMPLALLSIYLTILWRRRVQPYYCKWSTALLNAENLVPSGVSVTYKGAKVERVETTRLIFWNGGSEILKDQQVRESLTISAADAAEFLEWRLIAQSLEANEMSVNSYKDSRGALLISFKYMDPGHFAVFDLLHTGKGRHIKIRGVVEGAKAGVKAIDVDMREVLAMSLGGFVAGSVILVVILEKAFGFGTLGYATVAFLIAIVAALSWWATGQIARLPDSVAAFADTPSTFSAPAEAQE